MTYTSPAHPESFVKRQRPLTSHYFTNAVDDSVQLSVFVVHQAHLDYVCGTVSASTLFQLCSERTDWIGCDGAE